MAAAARAARVRLPSWIGIDTETGSSSPSTVAAAAAATSSNRRPIRSPSATATAVAVASANYHSPTYRYRKGQHTPKKAASSHSKQDNHQVAWEQRKITRTLTAASATARASAHVPRLVKLCQKREWDAALLQLQSHPSEADPVPILLVEEPQDSSLSLGLDLSYSDALSGSTSLYQETPLQVLCSLAKFSQDCAVSEPAFQLLQELLSVCPQQAIISHKEHGHTALRALAKNSTCTPKILDLLLTVMKKEWTIIMATKTNLGMAEEEAFQKQCTQPDQTGWRPLDHLLMALQHHHHHSSSWCSASTASTTPLDLIKVLVQHVGGDHLLGLGLGLTNDDHQQHGPEGSENHDTLLLRNHHHLHHQQNQNQAPPLIRLLSLGHSYSKIGGSQIRNQQQALIRGKNNTVTTTTTADNDVKEPHNIDGGNHHQKQPQQQPQQMSSILGDAVQFFLHQFPQLMDQLSLTTSCTPLHVALRNHGNNLPLIQCFLMVLLPVLRQLNKTTDSNDTKIKEGNENDNDNNNMLVTSMLACLRKENMYGDLPLHVACSVGTPVSVLRLVLEGTLQASSTNPSNAASSSTNNNLCWAVNHAGYTPIDLEWIRHMEDGKGFFMARSFYSLEAGGMKKTFWKQDEFYRVLLQQAVQQAMTSAGNDGGSSGSGTTSSIVASSPSSSSSTAIPSASAPSCHNTTPPVRQCHRRILANMKSLPQKQPPPAASAPALAQVHVKVPQLATPIAGAGLISNPGSAGASSSSSSSASASAVVTPTQEPRTISANKNTNQRLPVWQRRARATAKANASTNNAASTTGTSRATANSSNTPTEKVPLNPSEQPTWELLLHRIFLIIQTAATGRVPKTQIDLEGYLLHAACQLCFPVAPSLPLPLLELILFLYPDQLLLAQDSDRPPKKKKEITTTKDDKNSNIAQRGNLPLHFAVQPQVPSFGQSSPQTNSLTPSKTLTKTTEATCTCSLSQRSTDDCYRRVNEDEETSRESQQHICSEWEKWVKQLLEHGSEACSIRNGQGQLPLHKALEYNSICCSHSYRSCNNMDATGDTATPNTNDKKKIDRSFACVKKQQETKSSRIEMSPPEKARLNVICALVDTYPDSVDTLDPVSRLMPFQMAAASPFMPLDAVFYLLRRSPDAVLA